MLDSIDLRIAPGEFVAIIGQNGSGKTTLAKHLVGLLRPTAGTVLLEGRDRATMRPAETAAEVGYVFQNPDHQIFAATVEDEVAFGPRNFDLAPAEIQRRCDEVLRAVGLQDARALDPFLLSKGERQRLAVASVLALRPRLLILDEPTTGLDYREQRRMMALVTELNRDGIAIVMITHTPWLVAEYARRVVLIRHGRKLYDGGVREFFAQRRAARVFLVSRARGDRAFAPLRHRRARARRTRRLACGAALMPIFLYIERATFIHRLHPTVKVFALFVMFWSVYWVDHPLALLPLGLVMLALAQFTGAWPNFYRLRWLFILVILSTTLAWMVFYRKGPALINLPLIHLSRASLVFGLGRGLKLAELLATSVLFLSTTKVEEFTAGLARLGVPYRVGFAITLAFRLVPLFIDSALTVLQAQNLRGYDFNRGGPLERVKRYVPVLIPVFMGALRKANAMAMALEARGFGMSRQPTRASSTTRFSRATWRRPWRYLCWAPCTS